MTSPSNARLPTVAVVGTAAVVSRVGSSDTVSVLGGSGLLMAATLAALDHRVRLACHLGSDQDGERVLTWAAEHQVELFDSNRGQPTVRLTERLVGGEGAIIDGADDPGPSQADLHAALHEADIVLVGHLGTAGLAQVLHPPIRTVTPDAMIVANMSSAWADTWPISHRLWRQADIVTIGRAELARIDSTRVEAVSMYDPDTTLIVTNGGNGPVELYGHTERRIPVPALTGIVDTMGAGDALAATFATLRKNGLNDDRATERAISAAQRKCMTNSVEDLPRAAWADNAVQMPSEVRMSRSP